MRAHFCPKCGSRLQYQEIERRERLICLECGRIHYEQLIVGAGGLIEQDGRLLLLQRTSEPFERQWNLPAGHVEVDESPMQAVIREVDEETGLQVTVDSLVDIYFFDDHPRGNGIFIVYKCHIIGGSLTETLEGVNPTFFTREQIPGELAGGGHSQAIIAWQGVPHETVEKLPL